ncbi:MAG: hypothetical protein GXO89_01605 [Chlorobi bacterium]|nr:hypothetical protein [Chlorobiota bacterium]
MYEWWEAFSGFEKVFWYIAIPFSVILIIQMILTFAGMGGSDSDVGGGDADVSGLDLDTDTDIDVDTTEDVDTDGDNFDMVPSFHFFTIRNFIAFFTLFGWGGIAAFQNGFSRTWTIIIAFIAGVIALLAVSALFYFMGKLVDSGGSLRIRNALGKIGDVYIPIKANAGSIGKVQITVQGSLREMQAMTKGDSDLKTGTVVKVTGIAGNNILVVDKVSQ